MTISWPLTSSPDDGLLDVALGEPGLEVGQATSGQVAAQGALDGGVAEAAAKVDARSVAEHGRGLALLVAHAGPCPARARGSIGMCRESAEPLDRHREGGHGRRTCAPGVGRELEVGNPLRLEQPAGAAVFECEYLSLEAAEVRIDRPDPDRGSPGVEHPARVARHQVGEVTRLEAAVGRRVGIGLVDRLGRAHRLAHSACGAPTPGPRRTRYVWTAPNSRRTPLPASVTGGSGAVGTGRAARLPVLH